MGKNLNFMASLTILLLIVVGPFALATQVAPPVQSFSSIGYEEVTLPTGSFGAVSSTVDVLVSGSDVALASAFEEVVSSMVVNANGIHASDSMFEESLLLQMLYYLYSRITVYPDASGVTGFFHAMEALILSLVWLLGGLVLWLITSNCRPQPGGCGDGRPYGVNGMFASRHGIMFSIMSIFLTVLVVTLFSTEVHIGINDQIPIIERRVSYVNQFFQDYERYVTTAAMAGSIEVLNGWANGLTVHADAATFNSSYATTANSTITTNYLDVINSFSLNTLSLTATSSIDGANMPLVWHKGPWTLELDMHAQWDVNDIYGYWQAGSTPIGGEYKIHEVTMKDPYLKRVGGVDRNILHNTSVQSTDSDFLTRVYNDQLYIEGELSQEVNGVVYIAPTFLMRFWNDLSAHPLGIETLINYGDKGAQFNSFVDFMFWAATPGFDTNSDGCYWATPSLWPTDGKEMWFRLDLHHIFLYGVSDIAQNVTNKSDIGLMCQPQLEQT